MSASIGAVWQKLLIEILMTGEEVAPRGKRTLEIQQHTIVVDMNFPVLTVPERKLSYKFMAAEAYWILTGDRRVETIAPYNKNIAQFSDDGETFFGAYGPKIFTQMPYVLATLKADPASRQAGLTLWRENPPKTKDVPCTVAMFFRIRGGRLHTYVFMRSSDAWLGVPYDVFNFSMVGHFVAGHLRLSGMNVSAGNLYLTMSSSHLYEEHWASAREIISGTTILPQRAVPRMGPADLVTLLKDLRDTSPGDPLRWWEARE